MLWPVLGAMTLAALALLLFPLWRREGTAIGREAYDIVIYRDQLDEIERDLARGVVSQNEAEAARSEIGRRMLAAAKSAEPADSGAKPVRSRRPILVAATVIVISLPLAAGIGYLYLGAPELSGQPFAERAPAQGPSHAEIEVLVTKLSKRLEQSPGNLKGWLLLAATYTQLERFGDAATAYARAIPLASEKPETLSDITAAYGEVLIMANGGVVTPVARAAFVEALAKNGANVRARYYLGLALLQEGKASEALRIWLALAGEADAGTPWSAELRKRIRRIAKERDIDISKLGPPARPAGPAAEIEGGKAPPPGPDQADIEAASRMGKSERQAMIETMVARLAARLESEPDDFEGWRRLARSYAVLGRNVPARDALARAAALRPKDVSVLLLYAGAVLEAAGQPRRLPADFIAIMRQVITLDPDNREALWNLGRAASEAGDGDEAARLWRRLLEKLPPGNARRAMVEQAIEMLGKK
jgi:cytochrome c-type biogenesis protein CcmH